MTMGKEEEEAIEVVIAVAVVEGTVERKCCRKVVVTEEEVGIDGCIRMEVVEKVVEEGIVAIEVEVEMKDIVETFVDAVEGEERSSEWIHARIEELLCKCRS